MFVLCFLVTEALSKHIDHRNLFTQRVCCKRQSHFVYIGQGKGPRCTECIEWPVNPPVHAETHHCAHLQSSQSSNIKIQKLLKIRIIPLPSDIKPVRVYVFLSAQTSLGVVSALMWVCAGRTVGEHPGHHMKQDSRNTPNIHPCWNFSGAKKYVSPRGHKGALYLSKYPSTLMIKLQQACGRQRDDEDETS